MREKVGCKLNADVGFFVKVNQVEINVSILSRNESLIFNFVIYASDTDFNTLITTVLKQKKIII